MDRKERLTAFNRANILTAAKQLFCDKGVENTTVDDIARAAQYSKSTVEDKAAKNIANFQITVISLIFATVIRL